MTPTAYGLATGAAAAVAMTYLWAWTGHRYFDRLDAWWSRHWANGATALLGLCVATAATLFVIASSGTAAYRLAEALS